MKYKKILFILFLAAFLRLWKLGLLPVSSIANPFWMRLPSAISAIVAVYLVYVLAKKILKNENAALWSSFWIAVSPWHIAESRVLSQSNFATTAFLILLLLWRQLKGRKIRIILILFSGLLIFFLYPQAWIFQKISMISIAEFLSHFFKLVSFEFLFFFNDSFWWGGLREFGVMLPITVFPFLAGIYCLFFYKHKKATFFLASALFVLLIISSLNPFFPEGREFLVAMPFLSMIAGVGTAHLIQKMKSWGLIGTVTLFASALLLGYQCIVFWRLYTVHYKMRVENEIHNVKIPF